MVYDSESGNVVLFGGWTEESAYSDETWEWNGKEWTQKDSVIQPEANSNIEMIYDSSNRKSILFGVKDREIWEWSQEKWIKKELLQSKPSKRYYPAMTYDISRKKVVMFGGSNSGNNNETWEWDGNSWKQLMGSSCNDPSCSICTETTCPSEGQGQAMVYDNKREKVVLYGGDSSSETWEWNGDFWKFQEPIKEPTVTNGHAMTYDNVREKVILSGGQLNSNSYDETWSWDGNNWNKLMGNSCDDLSCSVCNDTTCPPKRILHAISYDSIRDKVVLFGGETDSDSYNNETWEWDGEKWTKETLSFAPSNRHWHKMIYDINRGKTILFGGNDKDKYCSGETTELCNDTWEWNGTNWTLIYPNIKPSGRDSFGMAYDSSQGKVIIFGGWSTTGPNDETWLWDGGGNDRPGKIITVSWESSGVTDDSTVTYQSLSVFFNAGGLGDFTGAPHEGVDLLTWKHDRWVTVSSNEADPDNLAPVTWETTDPVEIQTLLNSGLRKFNFAVVPTAPNGFLTVMGSIATSYAEVIVRYRIE